MEKESHKQYGIEILTHTRTNCAVICGNQIPNIKNAQRFNDYMQLMYVFEKCQMMRHES